MPQIESFSEKKAAARAATHHKAALLPRKRITYRKCRALFHHLLSGALSEASSLRSAATAAAV